MSQGSLEPQQGHRLYKEQYLLYDLDCLNRQMYIRIRLLVREDGKNIPTPVPPLYEARLGSQKPIEIPKRNGLEPRNHTACFESPEDPGKAVNRTVYNPYQPGSANWSGLARQVINSPGVLSANYRGETHDRRYEDFFA